MTPEAFDQLFTREALRPFQPRTGSEGLTPMLEVRTAEEVVVFVLALSDYNHWPARQAYLRGLGAQCAQRYPGVEAVRFGSEAWVRSFTPEELAARGARLVESYPDKREVVMVFGQLAGGTLRFAQAPLFRRPTGEVERLGPWNVRGTDVSTDPHSPLLEAFWVGYTHGKGA